MAKTGTAWLTASLVASSAFAAGCAERPGAKLPLGAIRQEHPNWVCRGLIGHFVGLASSEEYGAAGLAPLVGCWWIRGCDFGLTRTRGEESELEVHMDGPGWYWIDFDQGDFQLHQQVPFQLGADLAGRVRFAYSTGVASFWFEPTRQARVVVEASTALDVHGSTLWGSVLRRVPLVPIRRITADRLSSSAEAAFAEQIGRGVTVTYDVMRGQVDMSLGALRPGETPRRVFEDGTAWIENTRLLLPAAATHVFGPLHPLPLDIDVVVESGPGIAYRAVCSGDMPACFDDVAAGEPHRIPRTLIEESGTVTGLGAHIASLRVGSCPYYLIIASAGADTTLVALRMRAGRL